MSHSSVPTEINYFSVLRYWILKAYKFLMLENMALGVTPL